MTSTEPIERRLYEVSSWRVDGPSEPIPILLYQRADLDGPKPAVVYYHGVVQSKDSYLDSHPMVRRLADAGFVVALPDAPGHGERPAGTTLIGRLRESLPREFCADIERSADEAPILFEWLAARPEVDGRCLGVLGVSMGGFTAAVVAARLRDRLRAAVCIAGTGDLAACMAETDSIAPGKWGPPDHAIDPETSERIARIDPITYPDRFAPLPLLVLHGDRDTWNPVGTSQRFADLVRPSYQDAPDRFQLVVIPEAPHWPPHAAMVREAVAWLVNGVMSDE